MWYPLSTIYRYEEIHMINKECLKHIAEDRTVMVAEEEFVYMLPCEELRNFISNFTITFPNEFIISNQYTILPHGSATLVLFQYHEEIYSFLFGPSTQPQHVGNLANKCDFIFIIEFQPTGVFPFTRLDQKVIIDKIIPFSYFDNEFDRILRNIVFTATEVDNLVGEVKKELMKKMKYAYPKELTIAIKNIIQMEGSLRSEDISNCASYSSRHLNRMFNHYLGMSMKSFSRIVRINKSLQLLNEEKTTVAYVCEILGYYDMSHFVKDFKKVCTITPQDYKSHKSDFYNEVAKY